jgi:hypothetical protein
MKRSMPAAWLVVFALSAAAAPVAAIDSTITYQGHLTDLGQPANGPYDLRFTLQDGMGQTLGAPVFHAGVAVVGGVFSVPLDFGLMAFDGDDRRVEIAVSRPGADAYVALLPSVPFTAAPYALRSREAENAELADGATFALDAAKLGGLAPADYVPQTDARLADARAPLPGSAAYIQNQSAVAQNPGSFRITGTGAAGILSAATQFNLGNARVLSFGSLSVHLGEGTAAANTTGNQNVFVGWQAGSANTTGAFNSFVGLWAGRDNTTGIGNNFYGSETGRSNTIGCCNAFFGGSAGFANQTGSYNTFVGERSAQNLVSGDYNASLGAHVQITPNGLTNATAVGARAAVAQSNSLVLGAIAGVNGAPADTRVGIGTTMPKAKLEVGGGDILVGAPGQGIILKSPNGTQCLRLSIDDTPNFIGTSVPCP